MAKFSGFRTFKVGQTVQDIIDYLTKGLSLSLKELQAGLTKLDFADNFESQTIQITLPAGGVEVGISHNLGVIPSKRLIVRATGSTIDDGISAWTSTAVYFKNTGGTPITATIILMR